MTTTPRSVRVVLQAEVAKYIADMKLAGRETRTAFDTSARSISSTDRGMRDLTTSSSRLEAEVRRTGRGMQITNTRIDTLTTSARRGSHELDSFTGRLNLLVAGLGAVAPAAVPIGASLIPGIAGMAAGLGAGVGAVGVMVGAVHGLGDALKALDDHQLEPTAASLAKVNEEFTKIGPAGVQFVQLLDQVEPMLKDLQNVDRASMLPGFAAGIESLVTRFPEVKALVADIAQEVGDLGAEAGSALAGEKWDGFFDYLHTDAVPTLDAFAHATGNVATGLANMLVAFAPAERDFAGGLESMTEKFEAWSAGLGDSEGFQEFLAYLHAEGPAAMDLLGSLASALADIAVAAAPVGAVTLPILTKMLDLIDTIARSPLGTPIMAMVTAMGAMRIATLGWQRATTGSFGIFDRGINGARSTVSDLIGDLGDLASSTMTAGTRTERETARQRTALVGVARGFTKVAGAAAVFADGQLGVTDKLGLSNAAMGAAAGMMGGPWGAAIGGGIGLTLDFAHANDGLKDSIDRVTGSLRGGGTPEQSLGYLNDAKKQLADFQATLKNEDWNKSPIDRWKTIKNSVEGWFGDSDVEEFQKKIASAEKDLTAAALQEQQVQAGLITTYSTASKAMEDYTSAIHRQVSQFNGAFDAVTAYRKALKDAQGQKNDAGISGDSKTALENRQTLSSVAGAWNQLAASGAASQDQLKRARSEFVKLAEQMGVGSKQADRLAKKMLDIPTHIDSKVTVDPGQGIRTLDTLTARLDAINGKTAKTYVDVIQRGFDTKRAQLDADRHADGGEVLGRRYPYGDKVLTYLAPGEEVITNRHGEADQFRADRATGRIPRYSDGGRIPGGGRYPGYADGGKVGSWSKADQIAADYGVKISNSMSLDRRDKRLELALKKLEKAAADASDALDATKDSAASLSSGIVSGLTSDPWATSGSSSGGSVFGKQYADGSIGAALASLQSDVGNAQQYRSLEESLKGSSVTGAAYTDAISRGDVSVLQTLSAATPAEQAQYSALYGQRAALTASAGSYASQATYGKELAEQTAVQKQLLANLKTLTVQTKAIETQKAAAKKAAAAKTRAARAAGGKKAK